MLLAMRIVLVAFILNLVAHIVVWIWEEWKR